MIKHHMMITLIFLLRVFDGLIIKLLNHQVDDYDHD